MKLITFEGLDGCGKTSVINELKHYFDANNIKYYVSYEPGDEFGKIAKYGEFNITSEDTLYLWWLARIREQRKFMEMDVDIVIKDRYYDSTYVYQNFDNPLIYEYNFNDSIFLRPDLTIYLDVSPEISLQRMGKLEDRKEDLYETSDYISLEFRRERYKQLIRNQKDFRNTHIINTNDVSLEFVVGKIIYHIDGIMYDTDYREFMEKV